MRRVHLLQQLIPKGVWLHDKQDGNCDSHLKSGLIGPSETIPLREIRRRTRVVGAFPDGDSALMLVAALLRHIAGTKWGTRRYLSMEALEKQSLEQQHSA
jgi:hypothetical protein